MKDILPYDKTDPNSIEKYAKKLLNKSLRDVSANTITQTETHKGKLGQLVEEIYFQYRPNSKAQADFPIAGVELKTTPLKKNAKGFIAKERLVFNIIDYEKEHLYTFKESSFWSKNSLLLLMFFLFEKGQLDIDAVFKIIRLWRFPAKDLKIIKDDWLKIIQKIKNGKAHELSEGDTLYLGACTKGANKESTRKQPFSFIPAKQRAFSLKPKYLNFIIQESLVKEELTDDSEYQSILEESIKNIAAEDYYYERKFLKEVEPIIKDISQFKGNETFEEFVIKKFIPFYGVSENKLIELLGLKYNADAKNKFEIIARAILDVRKKRIEEFEKADVLMKTIRIESNNSIKESMSFRQIQFTEIVQEDWEDSTWYKELNRRFFFIVFYANNVGEYFLKKVIFWSVPEKDKDILEEVWMDTKNKIQNGNFENFIKASDEMIGHVRPKGRNAKDLMKAPNGTMQKKKSFWLNNKYIRNFILQDESTSNV